jgi:SAM-dependent methyltransferase
MIARALPDGRPGVILELGSGVPDIRTAIPRCIRSDIVPNPWIDRMENAYALSFPDASLSAVILFDVFHHLRYPGTALKEFHRVLDSHGRVIVFDPDVSLLAKIVYGLLHHEPLGLRHQIEWDAPDGWSPHQADYYAAQGNAHRIFVLGEVDVTSLGWHLVSTRRLSAISYVLSGGYSRPQVYPDRALGLALLMDRFCDSMPRLFSTRLLAVVEKGASESAK